MIVILGILILILLFSFDFHANEIDENYLSKNNTQPIKGIFVIIVFLSHIRTYAEFNHMTDLWTIQLLNYLGQLMVALFLFYSGYGIYEAIKNKGNDYISNIPKNRLGKTFFDFFISILLFLFLNLCIRRYYSVSQIMLSFIGWSNVGNSAWYMFAIFTLYILTYLCFTICKNKRVLSILFLTLCSFGYIYIMSIYRDNYWSSTYLCFVSGVWYSFFKEKIDYFLKKYYFLYYILIIFIVGMYFLLYPLRYNRLLMFNLVSIFFCLSIVFISMKISFKSKILTWLGNHLFWIYILQRIPMILFQYYHVSELHPYYFLFACLSLTILLAFFMNKFSYYIKRKIWK